MERVAITTSRQADPKHQQETVLPIVGEVQPADNQKEDEHANKTKHITEDETQTDEQPRPLSIVDLPPELIFHVLSFLPNSRLNVNPLISSPHATSIPLPQDDYNTNAHVDPEYLLRTEVLDPTPYYTDAQLVRQSLYSVMRTCKRFYEVAKALMWLDVVIKGGRGWISVVEGLGEYVGEDWYDVASSRARSLVRKSSKKYAEEMRRLESISQEEPLAAGELAYSTATLPMSIEPSAPSNLPSNPTVIDVPGHIQLSTSAPAIPQLDQIMSGLNLDLTTQQDPSSTPHQFPASVPTSPQPEGLPILAPVVSDISIGPQAISEIQFSSAAHLPSFINPFQSRYGSPLGYSRESENRAPVNTWRSSSTSMARKLSISRANSIKREGSTSYVRSKRRDVLSDNQEDAEADVPVEKEDLKIVRPPIDSPDLDFGEMENKFEKLDFVLRNGSSSLSRSNSATRSSSAVRPGLRSQSHQMGTTRPKNRLEREKELRREWERERDASRARARARSPSVMGGRRVRSPSISRSRTRRTDGDVGLNGAQSLMQVLERQGDPTISQEVKQPELDALADAIAASIDPSGTAAPTAVGPPVNVDMSESSMSELGTRSSRDISPFDTRPLIEPHHSEKTPADPDYEYEFDLPTRLPPIPQIQSLSFANFRTTGTRRTQEEATRGKFVTSQRLYHVLRNAPRLKRLAMTEYVDSALAIEVIEEIFLRGYDYGCPGEPEWETKRRSGFEPMEAIDLTGCVSSVFGQALEEFVERWLVHPKERRRRRRQREMDSSAVTSDDREGRGRSRAVHGFGGLTAEDHLRDIEEEDEFYAEEDAKWSKPTFPNLKRVSLRGCVTLPWDVIAALIGSCTCLTHLDLSFTRVSPATLEALGQMPDARLVALSLARSTRLTSESVRNFLCDAPAARTIVDLNLYGDLTYLSPLNVVDLEWIIRLAPCFQRQRLRYLDLSSSPLTAAILSPDIFPAQPGLRSLGLSYLPHLPLDSVTQFIMGSASNTEILTLTHSSTQADLPITMPALHVMMTLHGKLINPLTSPPFRIMSAPGRRGPHNESRTRLRVIELSETVRRALGRSGGSLDWRVIRSKGSRGWFVDVSAGWVREFDVDLGRRVYRFQRGLEKDHPWRRYLNALADAEGKVASNVGWHSHKCNVLVGLGMLCREEGLYGFSSFAAEG
jgi:hypothetical protein